MVEFESREIDFDKYHVFVLEYNKSNNEYASHCVRPTTATYEYMMSTDKTRVYTLEGSVIAFKHSTPIAEIMMECAVRGISLDFVEIVDEVPNRKYGNYKDNIIVQVIDLHKEKIEDYFDRIEAPKYYVVRNNRKTALKYVVVNRFKQGSDVDFLHGKYEAKAAVAAFVDYKEAIEYCRNANER